MIVRIPLHDEALMPMVLGPMTRVPDYALGRYGITWETKDEYQMVIRQSETDYENEYKAGDKDQMQVVSDASIRIGFGDNPGLLREAAAKVVARLAREINGEITILDHGAGPGLSAKALFTALDDNDKDRAFFTLYEPALDKLEAAQTEMKTLGARYRPINAPDTDMPKYVEPGSQKIFVGVASVHHHSHIPFELYIESLDRNGFLITADWHNSVWEEPNRFYGFLKRFDWPQKEQGLANFLQTYPLAKIPVSPPSRPEDRQANEDITNFWVGYHMLLKERGQQGRNAIFPSEGHRPVERYIKQMQALELNIESRAIQAILSDGVLPSNPYNLLPNSSLLAVVVAQKPE